MARIIIFVRQVRVQRLIKAKLHDTQVPSKSREVTVPHSYRYRQHFRIKLIDLRPASDNAQFMRPVIVNRFPIPDLS